ncbi:hypothetical protein C8F04DRAFT_1318620 [Mycena alexandri]|uniref:Uncharacterized protein n=1 Tax=Mycena alexandri TaxID=1745969 RepID=A0AAD6WQT1_9AGAR|nr:hypothetical protein C8F04DRAFT_1318620 [Mycena alexandri]
MGTRQVLCLRLCLCNRTYSENPRLFKKSNCVKRPLLHQAPPSKNPKGVLTQEREQVRTERGKPRLEKIESGMDINTEPSVEAEEILSDLGVPTCWSAYTWLFYSVTENESSWSPRYKVWFARLVFLILMLEQARYMDPAKKNCDTTTKVSTNYSPAGRSAHVTKGLNQFCQRISTRLVVSVLKISRAQPVPTTFKTARGIT